MRGHFGVGPRVAKALHVLHAQAAKQVAAAAQLAVEVLQHAEAEFPLAFHGDDAGVRQGKAGVGLELHPLLEVDQIQFHLVGTVAEGEIGDQDVQKRRFARAGLAGDEHVLRRPLAEVEVLEFHCAGPAQGDVDAAAAVGGPPLARLGGDAGEGHLDAAGVLDLAADAADDVRESLGRRRRVDRRRHDAVVWMPPGESPLAPVQHHRVRLDVGEMELPRRRQRRVHARQHEHPATGAAGDDALQPVRRLLGKVGGKISDDEHAVRLGHLAGKAVVFLDRRELVAEIDLEDVLHVVGQVGQPLLDVAAVRPNAAGDELVVVVGQVHEGGEVLAESDRIEDREADFARRHRRQHAEHDRLDRGDGLRAAFPGGLQQQERMPREREQ